MNTEDLFNQRIEPIMKACAEQGKGDIAIGILLGFLAAFDDELSDEIKDSGLKQIAAIKKQQSDRAVAIEMYGMEAILASAMLDVRTRNLIKEYSNGKTQQH